jgi:DNA-binding transcriptional MerR regulator
VTSSGASAASDLGGARGEALMSIGEVLAHLRTDFPDTTISKLRFLETEGLVEPRRTAAGYRKYTWSDMTRLRYVLTAQRDHYLPLRVIREQLSAVERGDVTAQSAAGLRPGLVAVPDEAAEPAAPLRLRRDELCARAGIDTDTLDALEQYGLISPAPGGYDADALEVASVAARLAEYGLHSRHLRAYRASADREVGLFSQLVAPMARQNGPSARARAAETVRELAALTERLHSALVRAGLRETLGR